MKHFLVHNCNFCGAKNIRFDVLTTTIHQSSHDSSSTYWQAFCQCSHCKKGCVLAIHGGLNFHILNRITHIESYPNLCLSDKTNISDHFKVFKIIIPPNKEQVECPKYVPENIKNIFDEATKCLSVDCFVASGAMFRLCLDLVSKDLLEKWQRGNQSNSNQPNKDQKNKLYDRIDFLILNGIISIRLKELAHCIRLDGNDSAHDGSTGESEALDCLDFTEALLTEVYTLPEQINEAKKRREERRAK
ncbi:DUF4145 domain-containing protein [Acinetobacter sp. ANC 4640]